MTDAYDTMTDAYTVHLNLNAYMESLKNTGM